MEAMRYECLIRAAFGLKAGGRMLDRWGDPAALANTDQFMEDNLAAVKVGAGYAFEIFTNTIINAKGDQLGSQEWTRLEEFTKRVVAAKDLLEVNSIIEDFIATVENRYIRYDNGVMSLI